MCCCSRAQTYLYILVVEVARCASLLSVHVLLDMYVHTKATRGVVYIPIWLHNLRPKDLVSCQDPELTNARS